MPDAKAAQLQMQMGAAFGTRDEIEIGKNLRKNFIKVAMRAVIINFSPSCCIVRKSIKSDPKLLWFAGESAYLTKKNYSIANDYLRSIILNYPEVIIQV